MSTTDLSPSRMRSDVRALSRAATNRPATAETEEAMRTVLAQHLSTLAAEETAKRLQAEAEAAAERAKSQDSEMESMMHELLDRLEAAEARATEAEQQAIYAGQQAARAAEQLMQTAHGQSRAAVDREVADVPVLRVWFATWGGWGAAVLATALAAGGYATSYRPLRAQLDGQTKLMELQTRRSSEAETSLRRSFERERGTLTEELNAARTQAAAVTASAAAAAAREAPTSDGPTAEGGDSAASAKAAKLEARAAKREAWLEKKAERAAKRAEHAEARKARGAGSSADAGEAKASESKNKAKPAAPGTSDDLGSDDPLEGL